MNNDNNKFKVSDLATNKQYRAIIILIFYFFFFLVLIIAVRGVLDKEDVSDNKETKEKVKEISKVKIFSSLKKKNFTYKYTLTVDDKVYVYNGEKYNDKDRFTITTSNDIKKYVQIDNFSFEIKNNEQVLTDKPVYFLDFFDVDLLENIIKSSKDKSNNIYTINNRELDNILDLQFEVNNKLDNDIIITLDNGIIKRIDINYTNYVKFNNRNIKKVLLTLEYDNFGNVDDFDIKNSEFNF